MCANERIEEKNKRNEFSNLVIILFFYELFQIKLDKEAKSKVLIKATTAKKKEETHKLVRYNARVH